MLLCKLIGLIGNLQRVKIIRCYQDTFFYVRWTHSSSTFHTFFLSVAIFRCDIYDSLWYALPTTMQARTTLLTTQFWSRTIDTIQTCMVYQVVGYASLLTRGCASADFFDVAARLWKGGGSSDATDPIFTPVARGGEHVHRSVRPLSLSARGTASWIQIRILWPTSDENWPTPINHRNCPDATANPTR